MFGRKRIAALEERVNELASLVFWLDDAISEMKLAQKEPEIVFTSGRVAAPVKQPEFSLEPVEAKKKAASANGIDISKLGPAIEFDSKELHRSSKFKNGTQSAALEAMLNQVKSSGGAALVAFKGVDVRTHTGSNLARSRTRKIGRILGMRVHVYRTSEMRLPTNTVLVVVE
jgi:hypothetical protein